MDKKPKPTAILKNWEYIHDRLTGNVYGHPDFPDGEKIITTAVINVISDSVYETKNSVYTLIDKRV